ncbi:hypothetical protein RD792_012676 [Penstemon davidsonii]|uniref:F-box domain-containing protein n=1 Tax=Penstemon davidsonii TaxID=160366 RepID=A0ABR0CYH1_9LAMI|nr:hypothetical protein RD792_012676 [Penstemon davidsonii]
MLLLLLSCFPLLLLSMSILKPNSTSRIESRISKSSAKFEILEEKQGISLLEIPDLPLDCILEKLSPYGLCSMAGVCRSLRERCKSDHFWEKHLKQKWSGVIGDSAYEEWQCHVSSKRVPKFLKRHRKFKLFYDLLDLFCNKSEIKEWKSGLSSSLPVNPVMSFYLALETGKFWFPAQVFNREVQKGSVGFMLSCYDALLCYDSTTNNFVARYAVKGRQMIEADIKWNRIRAPNFDTRAEVVHISDCLEQLKPNDHIEIQWRRNKDFPYGWWYGVVGHLEYCNGNKSNCQCHISDTVILEFKQFSTGSKWRKTMISRKDHREVGNEEDGFYGGIRKLYNEEEIAIWKNLWPNCTIDS